MKKWAFIILLRNMVLKIETIFVYWYCETVVLTVSAHLFIV